MCPIEIMDNIVKVSQTVDDINIANFIKEVISIVGESNTLEPLELIFPVLLTRFRYKNLLLTAIEKAAGDIKLTDQFIHQAKNLIEIFQDSSLSNKIDKNIRYITTFNTDELLIVSIFVWVG